jgi:Na+/proline symporter/signal transduction histidine kinase
MNFNIDVAIVVGFLLLTLVVGLGHGKSVKTIKDYALGGRNFSTGALVATIVATWASGSGFFATLSKTYTSGFYYLFASIGIGLSMLITSFILIPRMGEFLGKISIAEAMGSLYGNKVRLITAIAGTIGSAGSIAVQFKVFGNVVSYFIGLSPTIAIIISGVIATIYSAFGGIRAVTFTDILQGFAFGVIIPLLGFAIWSHFYHMDYTLVSALSDPLFSLDFLYDSSSSNFWSFIFLFVYFVMPDIRAADFQRISMGRDIAQVKKAFIISVIILVIIKFAIAWIPFIIHEINPNIESIQLLPYIVDTFSFSGLKGLIIIAIIAFAMSTADSIINASSVLFTHDIYGLFTKDKKNELLVAKIFGCILGFGTIILSLIETDLIRIIIFTGSFYFPLVMPPFILTLFGFRSSAKSVLIAMFAGLVATILWKILPMEWSGISQEVAGLLFATLCNTMFLFGSHYIFKQPGGWVGIKDHSYLDEQKTRKQQRQNSINHYINNFSIRSLCQKIAPHNEITYTLLGIYFIVCTITTMYSTQVELLGTNSQLMKIIYPSMLITGTLMAMYQIWPLSVATNIKKTIIETWYPIAIFYMLIFFSCFFVLVSKLAPLQISLFIMNLMIAALLLGWRLALPSIVIGFYLARELYQYFFSYSELTVQFGSPEFMLIYMMLFLGSAVIIFLKPKQEQQEQSDIKVVTLDHEVINLNSQVTDLNEKVTHYSERVDDQSKEIERLGATAQKILNNVNHELRLPVGNVMNFAEMLNDGLGKFNEDQLKTLSDEVYKNSNRLSSMILNMLDLATLDAKKIELSKSKINFSELVKDRISGCIKIYLGNKKINFEMKIEENIFIDVDPNYIRQTVDNLLINAINFSTEGVIKISVLRKNNMVEFMIIDQGIGIPQSELYDIFTPFKMGSNTESKAEGRGVGLALCKAAIEAHEGSISVESKGIGALFRFVLRSDNKCF